MENVGLEHIRAFSFKELKDITNEFSKERAIGSGGSGVVYKGVLDNGDVIAVKKLDHTRYDSSGKTLCNGKAQFHNEVMNLFGVQHPNIIRLLGYCSEVQNMVSEYDGKRVFVSVEERVLCLEYMKGGCLKDHLSEELQCGLEWHVRYNIMKGICEGLKYLHTGSTNPIYHLDLKPENIFLDGNMTPKIGDFGISRLPAGSRQTFVAENISGTFGYMPPEYLIWKKISPKNDIFSLGVIMIDVIAGHKAKEYVSMPPQEFIELVHENWSKLLQPTEFSHLLVQVKACIKIALRCVEFHREKRPSITEIIDELNKIDPGQSSAPSQEKTNKQFGNRYKRTSRIYTRPKYQPQSVDHVTGAMGSLVPKLHLLLKEYNHKLGNDRIEKVWLLQRDLIMKEDILRDAARLHQHKLWTKEERDLTYEAENIVDTFLELLGAYKPVSYELWKAFDGLIRKFNHFRDRRRMHEVHKCDVSVPIVTDPRSWAKEKCLEEMVGIQVPRNEVLRKLGLGDDDDWRWRHPSARNQIVSILGMAGLGKTTLARAVYESVRERFHSSAWVFVSQNYDIKKVFMEILTQFDKDKSKHNTADFDIAMLIRELRIQLSKKRYLIVLDDIWDVQTLEWLSPILVHDRLGSNVIITTRNFQVAASSGQVYKLKELSREHSEELFNSILFGGKEKCPAIPSEIPEKLLQKCGGVPLAIITIANSWAKMPKDDWPKVYNSIDFGYGESEDVENMRKILLLSYYDLPDYLRTCLLHLNMFPEAYSIRKETLIWMWAAEGFIIPNKERREEGFFHEESISETGERYFIELINRSLIMPVEDSSRCIIDGCLVHDLVRDMISCLSSEEDFMTVLDGRKQHSPTQGIAHRLAVRDTASELLDPLAEKRTEHVRSFNTIKCHFGMMISLSRFKALRVLSIEECTFMDYHPYDLKHLGKLLQLRYLGLYNTPIHELPQEVGDLRFLETLDLRGTMVRELPLRVCELSHLKCLRADENTIVPDWIGNLTSLEELRMEDVGESLKFVKEVGKLEQLRNLEFSVQRLDRSLNKILLKSLRNLDKIQVLRLLSRRPVEEANWESYVPPQHLRELCLAIAFSRLPKWILDFSAPFLSRLCVNVKALDEAGVHMLGKLPELVSLELLVPSDVSLNVKGDRLFRRLRCFHTSAPFTFLPGAMPALEFLRFKIDVRALKRARFALNDFASLENLHRLERVEVGINSRGAREVHVVEAEEALKRTVDNHPNNPTSDIKRI